jgi:hypothetical protein
MDRIEIIEADIKDDSIAVGSGCQWTGKGAEPQWNNPKCTKAYDHIERHHGFKKKPDSLKGRAASKKKNQGQWLNNEDWVNAEREAPKYQGRYILDFNRPVGRVYHPDGTVTEDVTRVLIRRNPDGTLKCGYPVLNSDQLKMGKN